MAANSSSREQMKLV